MGTGEYSVGVRDHFYQPRNSGAMRDADVVGCAGAPPGQGNFMMLYIGFDDQGQTITRARFQTYGCPSAIACGSWISDWLPGKTAEAARAVTAKDVMAGLGGLPFGREHCADLAKDALADALRQFTMKEKVTK